MELQDMLCERQKSNSGAEEEESETEKVICHQSEEPTQEFGLISGNMGV